MLQSGQIVEHFEGEQGEFEVVRVTACSAVLRSASVERRTIVATTKTIMVKGQPRKVMLEQPITRTIEMQSSKIIHVSPNASMRLVRLTKEEEAVSSPKEGEDAGQGQGSREGPPQGLPRDDSEAGSSQP